MTTGEAGLIMKGGVPGKRERSRYHAYETKQVIGPLTATRFGGGSGERRRQRNKNGLAGGTA
jgi:hypothetical protein